MFRRHPRVRGRVTGLAMLLAALVSNPLSAGVRHTVAEGGLEIEMALSALGGSGELVEGAPVSVRFAIRDEVSGEPLAGLYPAAWLDLLPTSQRAQELRGLNTCQDKVEAFVGGSLLAQPALDMNVYYVLALNEDATISVVDPLFGFGGSKLLEMVFLDSPGEDWVLTEDQRTLFVTLPKSDAVAVIDTDDWTVERNIEVGRLPTRLALQADGQYLWVTHGAGEELSGVSVIEVGAREEVARISTGLGEHDVALSTDDRWAFVTNQGSGTVTIIDTARLEKVADVATGGAPTALAFSDLGAELFVAHAESGHLAVVDPERAEVSARIEAEPGLGPIAVAPGGRLLLVPNPAIDVVHVIDAASRRIVQTGDMEAQPYEISFSDELAYVAHRGSEIVLMLPLSQLGREGEPVAAIDFPGGQNPPGRTSMPSSAATIVQAPGATAVLVANALDRSIYFYKEGMAAPMGHFKNYGRQPRAVVAVDRSLRETAPGIYETTAKLSAAGQYELALFLDTPRMTACIPLSVARDGGGAPDSPPPHVRIRTATAAPVAGEALELEIELRDGASGERLSSLDDLRVLTFLAPGVWQRRQEVSVAADGRYRAEVVPPSQGIYYVFVSSRSLGLELNQSPSLIFQVHASPATVADATPSKE